MQPAMLLQFQYATVPFFWVDIVAQKATAAKLCLGQMPAQRRLVLVPPVGWPTLASLAATSQAQLE